MPADAVACTVSTTSTNMGSVSSYTMASTAREGSGSAGLQCSVTLAALTTHYVALRVDASSLQLTGPGGRTIPFTASLTPTGASLAVGNTINLSSLSLVSLFSGNSSSVPLYFRVAPASGLPAGTYRGFMDLRWYYSVCSVGVLACLSFDNSPGFVRPLLGTPTDWGSVLAAPDLAPPPSPSASISPDGTAVTGLAEPGSTVNVIAPDGTTVLGTDVAASDGSYRVTLDEPQIDGESLTITASDPGGTSAPESLDAPDVLVAVDDLAILELDVVPSLVANAPQTENAASVLGLSVLGDAVTVDLLQTNSVFDFQVAENTTRALTVDGDGGALLGLDLELLGLDADPDFDLIVYREADGAVTEFARTTDWLEYTPGGLGLLFPTWDATAPVTVELDGGASYYFVLANSAGLLNLTALADIELRTSADVTTDYANPDSVSGSVAGNVITDAGADGSDVVPAGTEVALVNGLPIVGPGTGIAGTHGLLQIDPDGSYTYTADPQFTGTFGDTDVFTYTIEAPDGSTETADLVVSLDFAGVPEDVADGPAEPFMLEESGLTIELAGEEVSSFAMDGDADPLSGTADMGTQEFDLADLPLPLHPTEAHEQPI